MNNIDGGQVWYYYDIPENTGPLTPAPPVSQIPLLNGLPPPQCEPIPQRRGGEGINSKYIKLAKAGGRKDLLLYKDFKNKEGDMQAYPRVEWFDHPDTKPDSKVGKPRIRHPELQDRYGHIKIHEEGPLLTTEAPFNTDELNTWNRQPEDSDQYLTKVARQQKALNKIQLPPLIPVPRQEAVNPNDPSKKLIKPPLGENNEPISFSHLLSHGYQADWSKAEGDTRRKKMETKRKDDKEQKQKRTQHLLAYKKSPGIEEERPLFKLKKFSNLPSKVYQELK